MLLLALAGYQSAFADVTKADNSDSLDLNSAWVGGVVPSGTDSVFFDNTLSSTSYAFGYEGNLSMARIYNPAGTTAKNITISGPGLLSFYGQGYNGTTQANNPYFLDISQAAAGSSLTINSNVQLMNVGSGNVAYYMGVNAGSSITLSGTITKNGAGTISLNKSGAGTVNFTGFSNQAYGLDVQSGTLNVSGTFYYNASWNVMGSSNQTGVINVKNGGFLGTDTTGDVTLAGNTNATSILNIENGGTFKAANLYLLRNSNANAGRNAIVNQNGGTVNLYGGTLGIVVGTANAGNSTATYNLNGGTLNLSTVTLGGGGVLNLNGGTIKLLPTASGNLFQADTGTGGAGKVVIQTNGAVIDTNGRTSTSALAMQHDTLGPVKDGGLTVQGGGTLILSSLNSYTGDTVISAGTTLNVGGAASLGLGNVIVDGILVLNNGTAISAASVLNFNTGSSIQLNYTGAGMQIAGLIMNGVGLNAGTYDVSALEGLGITNFSGSGSLIVLNTIPEPSAAILFLAGIGLLISLKRLSRRNAALVMKL
jgi:autotransporter-associated beta strand protein